MYYPYMYGLLVVLPGLVGLHYHYSGGGGALIDCV
jgi:hypothetical protein